MATLYVVATPIGNLSDLSPRAVEVLQQADLIAAEDTRVTRALCNHFGIDTPCVSNHRHNEDARAVPLVTRMLEENLTVALVTDAGTPAISDPGSFLVHEAAEAGIPVMAVPGCNAMAAALSVSGFDTREFAFYGFLPRKNRELHDKLAEILQSGVPVAVVHESPHRVVDLVETIADMMPECYVSASCDLTKLYEKTIRGRAGDVLDELKANPKTEKGEYCLVLDMHEVPGPKKTETELSPELQLLALMLEGKSMEVAAGILGDEGMKRNALYKAQLNVKKLLSQENED